MLDKQRTPSFITGFLLFLVLMLPTSYLLAADIEFVANGPKEISLGEQFEISFSVNGNGSSFIGPPISGFAVLSGPNPSTSSSVQIINGQMSQSITTSLVYYLQATQPGTFTIPGATITVNGKKYKSNSLTIKVIKGQSAATRQQDGLSAKPLATLGNKDVFLRAFVSKTNPVEGEQVIVNYKIYTRVPIPEYAVTKLPSSIGFWAQDLLEANYKPKQSTERINGQPYVVAEIKKEALFPQKAGKLVIQPIQVDVIAQLAVKQVKKKRTTTDPFGNDPFFDSFFNDVFSGPQVEHVKRSLTSNSLTINVQSLPNAKNTSGKPVDFTGAVGQFNLSTKVDKNAVRADEPITLTVTISGKGNIKLIENPKIIFPTDFEVYDPKVTDNIITSGSGISGTKSFEYILIPRNQGKFTIKPFSFTYYDLVQRHYVTQTSPSYTFNVSKGDGRMYTTGNQNMKSLDNDIRFIKQGPPKLRVSGEYFWKSILFWIWLFLPALLFVLFLILMKNELQKRRDAALMKNRRATKMARKRLSKAKSYLAEKNSDRFYEEVSQALWNYLSDKYYIQRADLSMETVRETLLQKNIPDNVIDDLIKMLEHCEYARFAIAGKASDLQQVYDSAITLITTIEDKLK